MNKPAGAAEPAAAEPAGIADIGRLAIVVEGDRGFAVQAWSLQLLRWRGRRPTLDDGPGPLHRVTPLGDDPGDPDQIHGLVGVVEGRLRRR